MAAQMGYPAPVPSTSAAHADGTEDVSDVESSKPLELVFSFDTTGTMNQCLDEVRSNLEELITDMIKIPNIRIAVFAHGDYFDGQQGRYVTKYLDFTTNQQALVEFVKSVEQTDGGDFEECYELVMKMVREELSWTVGSQKALVLIGDAVPHPVEWYRVTFPHHVINWRHEIQQLALIGCRVYAVQAHTPHNPAQELCDDFYKALADGTEGSHLHLTDFSNVQNYIMAICKNELGVDELEDFFKNLEEWNADLQALKDKLLPAGIENEEVDDEEKLRRAVTAGNAVIVNKIMKRLPEIEWFKIMKKTHEPDCVLLHQAAQHGKDEIITALLPARHNPLQKDQLIFSQEICHASRNALHVAIFNDKVSVAKALLKVTSHERRQCLLLETYEQSGEKRSPLHLAVSKKSSRMAKFLLENVTSLVPDIQMKDAFITSTAHGLQLCLAAGKGLISLVMLGDLLQAASQNLAERLIVKVDDEDKNALHWAIHELKEKDIQQLATIMLERISAIKVNGLLCKSDHQGSTILHQVAAKGLSGLVHLMLEKVSYEVKDAFILAKDSDTHTALYKAAIGGHAETVKKFYSHISASKRSELLLDSLHKAASSGHASSVQLLLETISATVSLERDDAIFGMGDEKLNVLHFGARGGHIEVVKVVIKLVSYRRRDELLLSTDASSNSALYSALEEGHEEVARLLLDKISSGKKSELVFKTYGLASERNKYRLLERMLENCVTEEIVNVKDSQGINSLHWAALAAKERVVILLLRKMTSIAKRDELILSTDKNGSTPLQLASKKGVADKLKSPDKKLSEYETGYVNVVKPMLTEISDPNRDVLIENQDEDCNTALHFAAAAGYIAIVKLLVSEISSARKSALVTKANAHGLTPLLLASREGHQEVVNFILGQLNDEEISEYIFSNDRDGFNALHRAAGCGHYDIVKLLLESVPGDKRDELIQSSAGKVSSGPANVNALHLATCEGHEMIVEYLLNEVSDNRRDTLILATVNDLEVNALHLAALRGHDKVVKLILKKTSDRAKEHAILSTRSSVKVLTPLHFAVLFGQKTIVELMLHHLSTQSFFNILARQEAYCGFQLLHLACLSNDEMVECILSNASKATSNSAYFERDVYSTNLQHLVNSGGTGGVTPIQLASLMRRPNSLDHLLNQLPSDELRRKALEQDGKARRSVKDMLYAKQETAIAILKRLITEYLPWKLDIKVTETELKSTEDVVQRLREDFLMNPNFPGKALIFTNTFNSDKSRDASGMERREDWDEELHDFEKALEGVCPGIKGHFDQSMDEMDETLKEFNAENKDACVQFIVLSTHGEEGHIYDGSGEQKTVQQFIDKVVENHGADDRPKVIVVNSCRNRNKNTPPTMAIHSAPNVMVVFSTLGGQTSYRGLLAEALCKAMEEMQPGEELKSVLAKATNIMNESKNEKQCAEIINRRGMTKKLKLKSSVADDDDASNIRKGQDCTIQ